MLVNANVENAEKLANSSKYSKLMKSVPNYVEHLKDLRVTVNTTKDVITVVAKLQVRIIYLFIYIRVMGVVLRRFGGRLPDTVWRHTSLENILVTKFLLYMYVSL